MFDISPIPWWLREVQNKIYYDKSGCWLWTSYTAGAGYAYYPFVIPGWARKNFYIHRFFWMYKNGSVPDDSELDHICDNKLCVNPDHLQAVSHKRNMARAFGRELDKCKHGHDLNDPNNVYYLKNGHRYCRICVLEKARVR